MQLLYSREANIDVVWVDRLKIVHLGNLYPPTANVQFLGKQVLDAGGVKEVISCFFDNICGVDEEEKIAISLFVKIQNQAGHDQRLAAAGCHIEQKMKWVLLPIKSLL